MSEYVLCQRHLGVTMYVSGYDPLPPGSRGGADQARRFPSAAAAAEYRVCMQRPGGAGTEQYVVCQILPDGRLIPAEP